MLRSAFDASAALGYPVFESVGCATCHSRSWAVNGLYSDLLLHDMGDRISDSGGYGMSAPPGGVRDLAVATGQPRSSGEAGPTEWRTPPLWGVADSAPYLHDGRASTLDEAIRLHGGEAAATATRYTKLSRATARPAHVPPLAHGRPEAAEVGRDRGHAGSTGGPKSAGNR